jgi:hypothetical protein
MARKQILLTVGLVALLGLGLWSPSPAMAHCDGLDGPVVTEARQALEKGDVTPVLKWVKKDDERAIRAAFEKTLVVRGKGAEAKELADTYFFETLVRLHRVSEGAPYTGLKPAGRDLGPAIPLADKALHDGNATPLLQLLINTMEQGFRERYREATGKKSYREDDVEAGRHYVEAYVAFIHYVERLYEAAAGPAPGHYPESGAAAAHEE